MNESADPPKKPERIAKAVIDAAFAVHKALGPGLLINFNVALLKDGIKRMAWAYHLHDKGTKTQRKKAGKARALLRAFVPLW